jgi:hypothetical protein
MPRSMTVFGALLLLLTIILYVGTVANLTTIHDSDPAGNSLSQAYAVFMVIALWILLAALLVVAGLKGEMPRWAPLAAVLLLPASGAAALAAVRLLSDAFYRAQWPIVIPAVSPLVIIAFALWAYLPAFRGAVPATAASAISGTIILLLSIAPWPAVAYRARHGGADRSKAEAARQADEPRRVEEERRRNLEAFHKLTSESELEEWLRFRTPGNELREQALEGIRRLPRRQADAELMIARRLDYFWDDVPQLDLAATPVICEGARAFLRERARDIQPALPSDPPSFSAMVERVEPYLPTMQWLVDQHCDCDAELAALEATVRIYPDSPVRSRFLSALTRIRQPR